MEDLRRQEGNSEVTIAQYRRNSGGGGDYAVLKEILALSLRSLEGNTEEEVLRSLKGNT